MFIKGLFIIAVLIFSIPVKLIISLFNWTYGKLDSAYPKILKVALDNRMAVVGMMLLLFLFSILWIAPRIGSELIPEVHQGEFNVDITLPVGTPVEKTEERISKTHHHTQQIHRQSAKACD